MRLFLVAGGPMSRYRKVEVQMWADDKFRTRKGVKDA